MFCSNCGMQLDDDANFCARCGKPQKRIIPNNETTIAESQTTLSQGDDIDLEVARLRAARKSTLAQQNDIEREVARLRVAKKNDAIAGIALAQPYVSGFMQTCQSCRVQAPTKYVEFYQNIGIVILRFHKSIKGNLCKACINRYFWEFTSIDILFGWWGVISFIVTPFYILNNVVRYIGSFGMQRVPSPMDSHRSFSERAVNFLALFLVGVVAWVVLIFLDFLLRANSYYLNPNANAVQGVLLSGTVCLGAWFLIAALVAFVIKR